MHAKKSFGQHFLKDQSVIMKILAAADIHPGEHVVEVGPGMGALTDGLAERTEDLTLIEADRDLLEPLKEKYPKAEIIQADAAQFDFSFHKDWIFVSNLPYNSGNAIVMNVLQSSLLPKRMVIMVQKEVGDRMMGRDPGILSVAVSLYAHVEKVCAVSPGAFFPPPKVDSVVLKLIPHPKPVTHNPERVLALAKAGFANRRKQLHKNLADAGFFTGEQVKSVLTRLGYSPLARAEELKLEDWIALSEE